MARIEGADRLAPLNLDELTPGQRIVYDEIVSGPRGGIGGPFEPWLRSPELAGLAQRLGAFCRYRTSLEPILSELAILIVASQHKAQIEWVAHFPIAVAAGLPVSVAECIRSDSPPDIKDDRLSLVADVVFSLTRTSRLSDELYTKALSELGEQALVELVGVVGYYTFVALTLNVFRPSIPNNAPKPFPEYT
ncbi:MAG: carboxymuconolactone decarboxylase family protein [Hyphomonas sp.]|nr:carboxymuconolactone decarboxylase family protein [Hyphomonas sp.]